MVKRIITALVIIACVIPPLLYGGILLKVLVGLIVLVASFELVSLLPNRKSLSTALLALLFLLNGCLVIIPEKYSFFAFAVLIFVQLATPLFRKRVLTEDVFFLIAISTITFILGKVFFYIYSYNHLYIWYILLATYGCDTGAYFVGSIFGKTKLLPEISPKKTVEGAVGGWATGAILSALFAIFVVKDMPLILLIVGSLWLPIVSQIGDLSFSNIKRDYHIKDFSNIFPGHGGFLDRIDSLIFTLVAFAAVMVIII